MRTLLYNELYVTRYMGSKLRLLDFIVPALHEALPAGGVFIDLMAGTQSVGYAMKPRNHVVANDVQAYALAFAEAIVVNTTIASVRDRVQAEIVDRLQVHSEPGWFTETYQDTYFSHAQCLDIERLRSALDTIDDRAARQVYFMNLAYAMAHCQSTPGHFAQFMPADHPRVGALRSLSVLETFIRRANEVEISIEGFENRATQFEVSEFLRQDWLSDVAPAGSLAYLDPPYTAAQYSRFYHLLETVYLNDQPVVAHKAKYRGGRHQSPFCSPKLAPDAFGKVIGECADRGWSLAISYSNHGIVEVEKLLDLLRQQYGSVRFIAQEFDHSTQGKGMVRDRQELLFVASEPG